MGVLAPDGVVVEEGSQGVTSGGQGEEVHISEELCEVTDDFFWQREQTSPVIALRYHL